MTFPSGFLTLPAVKRVLDPIDAGPRQCCAEYALVDCDGETDFIRCGLCDYRFSRPCVAWDGLPTVDN